MQQNWSTFSATFNTRQPFVLAVIVETHGSTYHKAGAMMLIDQHGKGTGLLSGGCLEEDIGLHAQAIMQTNIIKRISYNLQSDDDAIWGLGLGCDGALDIALIPLGESAIGAMFEKMLSDVDEGRKGRLLLSVAEEGESEVTFHSLATAPASVAYNRNDERLEVPIIPPKHIVVCGAGPDADPMVAMMTLLGWQVSIVDHRKVALNRAAFSACQHKVSYKALDDVCALLSKADGVVIMTHSLERDGRLLVMSLDSNVPYVGLLGPQARRDKLLTHNNISHKIANKIHAPIGLNIGGRGPEAIALSVCAEIQSFFAEKPFDSHSAVLTRVEEVAMID